MTQDELLRYLKSQRLAVLSSLSPKKEPQASLVGIAVSDQLEIIFDTVKNSRKYQNLILNPKVALVIGWQDEITVQYEGLAIELTGPNAPFYREIYFSAWTEGRDRAATWPGLVHFKISPSWLRYSNFNTPVQIQEWTF